MQDIVTGEILDIDPQEFREFRKRQGVLLRFIWLLTTGMVVAVGFALAYIFSVGVGLVAAAALGIGVMRDRSAGTKRVAQTISSARRESSDVGLPTTLRAWPLLS